MKNILKNVTCVLTMMVIFFLSSSQANAWDGKEDGTGTHAFIVTQAMQMLQKDMSSDEPKIVKENLEILKSNLKKLQLGSTYPDYNPDGYDLYQDHFWDPDTGNNFSIDNSWYKSYPVYETAETQVRKFALQAKTEWENGNYEKATWLLGQAMHYLGDINTPYHAANITAVDSPGHIKYESYVEKTKAKYALSSMDCKTSTGLYADTLGQKNFSKWMTEFSTGWAKSAKKLYYSHSTMKHSWKDWDYSATEAIHNSQISTAGFLYRFLNEVSGILGTIENSKLNQLMVLIKSANEKNAGTDSYIYFGFQTKDGKNHEWSLDNPGNDFERNQEDSYILNMKEEKIYIKDILRFWLRKEKFQHFGDDWKLENIRIIADEGIIHQQNINAWLKGNKIYYININQN